MFDEGWDLFSDGKLLGLLEIDICLDYFEILLDRSCCGMPQPLEKDLE